MNVPTITLVCALLMVASACNQKKDDHHHTDDEVSSSGNEALYDEVMAVHDEVMPKMNDLHKAKTSLQTRLELPGVADDEKQEIQQKIARIDSASESMMVWMRQFQPVSESAGEDSARAYLEKELVKVKKVRENIYQTLESVQ